MQKHTRILLSCTLATAMLVFTYWISNLPYQIPVENPEKSILSFLEQIKEGLHFKEKDGENDALFINLAFDKAIAIAHDTLSSSELEPENRPVLGRTAITDRSKLIQLLKYLKEKNNYRYILLDVFFENNISTEWDEELFELILSMPRIVIPYHRDAKIADERLLAKAGLADYTQTRYESDFVKYSFVYGKELSLPVRMYEDMTGRKILKHGFIYTDGFSLVRKSLFMVFNHTKINYFNLGSDLLGDSIPGEKFGDAADWLYSVPELTEDKYIVAGSFVGNDDMHSTYLTSMPGAVINFDAYTTLMNGGHKYSFWIMVVIWMIFFFHGYIIISRPAWEVEEERKRAETTMNNPIRKTGRIKQKLLSTSWIKKGLLLYVLLIFTYGISGEVYDIFITSFVFTLLDYFVTHRKQIRTLRLGINKKIIRTKNLSKKSWK